MDPSQNAVKPPRYYAFGLYVLDALRGVLWHDGQPVPLTPKVLELLAMLVTHAGEPLAKDELIRRVWAGTVVEENNLARHISTIRKALGERPGQREYIATIPGVGYRFVADVRELPELPPECRPVGQPNGTEWNGRRSGRPDSADELGSPTTADLKAGRSVFSVRVLTVAALVLIAVATGATAAWITMGASWRNQSAPSPDRSLRQLTYEGGLQQDVAWSPDGSRIAYASDRLGNADIWIQNIDGSAPPLRLTTAPANDWQPTWSPDSRSIAFRSERDGGGLYIIGVDGTRERQLSRFGTHPHWSPDGARILFSRADPETAGAASLCIVTLDGQPSRPLARNDLEGFSITNATWHPDGRVTAWGRDERNDWAMATFPVEGGTVVRSAIDPTVQRQISAAGLSLTSFAWAPGARFVYFEGRSDSVRNVWRVTVNPRTLAWSGRLERLTTGPGRSAGVAVSPDGRRLAFGVSTARVSLWAYGFDSARGRITDAGEDVTPGDADDQGVDASSDGRRLVYRALRNDQSELWERSGSAGLRLLASTREWRYSLPRWSPDGSRVAYLRTRNNPQPDQVQRFVSILAVDNGEERSLSVPGETMMVPADWRTDGSALLGGCRERPAVPMGTCLVSTADGSIRQLAHDDRADLVQHRFSPDQRWISFGAIPINDRSRMTIYVMPSAGGSRTAITDGASYDDKPRWGPDGHTLYFVSNRGGRSDVWGRRFSTETGLPEGEVFRVTTFDRGPRIVAPFLGQLGMAISKDRIFLPMYEANGHIWVLDRADQ